MSGRSNHKTDPFYRFNTDGFIHGNQLTQLGDEYIQATGSKVIVFRVPELVEDHFPADHFSRLAEQKFQNPRFTWGKQLGAAGNMTQSCLRWL